MLKVYRDIKQFCTDLIHPYICALRTIMDLELWFLQTVIADIAARLATEIAVIQTAISDARTMLTNRMNVVELYFATRYTSLKVDLVQHTTENNNPHNLNIQQLVTVSAVKPIDSQGATSDIWIEYESLYSVELGLSQLTAQDITNVRNACIALYLANPIIELTAADNSGNLGTLYDTRLVAGASGVTVASAAYNRIQQTLKSLSVDTTNLPRYFDGTQLKTMTLTEFIANFVDPVGSLGYNPYIISTNAGLSGYAPVSDTPVFSDTRAISGTTSFATASNYFLMKKLPGLTLNISTLTSVFNFVTPVDMSTQFLKLIQYVLLNRAGYRLRYNINGAGSNLGTTMVDTRLNSSQQVVSGGYYSTVSYVPYGSAVTISSYALRGNVT